MRAFSGAFLAAAAAASLAWPAQEAQAFELPEAGLTVTATPSVTSDYLFRGISQTREKWAGQFALDAQHESGLYAGAFLSNTSFLASPWNDTRQELDLLAGYRFSLGGLGLDIGYVGYFYPGQDKAPGGQMNEYHEAMLKASYSLEPVKFSAAAAYSPNFFGRSGDGYYLEGGADVSLPLEFTAFGRVGRQWIERNSFFGTPDYTWYGLGVQRQIYAGVTAAVGWYGTGISKGECAPVAGRTDSGQGVCADRVVFTLSRTF